MILVFTSNFWITDVNSFAQGYMVVCYTSNSSQLGKTAKTIFKNCPELAVTSSYFFCRR